MNTHIWPEDVKGGDHCEDLDVDGSIILKRIKINMLGTCGLDLSGSRYGSVSRCSKHRNELLGSIKGG
jgi:hypothetical protein